MKFEDLESGAKSRKFCAASSAMLGGDDGMAWHVCGARMID